MSINGVRAGDKKHLNELYCHEETTAQVNGAQILKVPDLNKVSFVWNFIFEHFCKVSLYTYPDQI
jgi:hypothetical protein